MAAYLVVDSILTNPEMYEEYKLKAKPLVEKFGGEYLARGGNVSLKENKIWTPARMVLVRFVEFFGISGRRESDEHQEVLKISKSSADRTVLILEGI